MAKRALTPAEKAYYRGFAAALGSLAREFQEPGMAAHVAQANGVTLLMLRAAGVRGIDLDTFKEELVLSENRKRTK